MTLKTHRTYEGLVEQTAGGHEETIASAQSFDFLGQCDTIGIDLVGGLDHLSNRTLHDRVAPVNPDVGPEAPDAEGNLDPSLQPGGQPARRHGPHGRGSQTTEPTRLS